jgi:hypothetical protein
LVSSSTKDITPPTGTKRVVFVIPPGAAGAANPVRIRCGTTGAASNTADLTTVVAASSAYVDVVVASNLNGTAIGQEQIVEVRTKDPMTWIRVWNSAATTHNCYAYYYVQNVEGTY